MSTLATGGLVIASEVMKHVREHPETVNATWDMLSSLLKKKKRVIVTGMKWAGKTVLCDFLSGAGYREGYIPPDASIQQEDSRMPRPKGLEGFILSTIPGDEALPRRQALDDLLGAEIAGVLHVVSNGYVAPRSGLARGILEDEYPTIEDLRRARLNEEVDDLRNTLRALEEHWRRVKRPFWFLLVLGKTDLWMRTQREVFDYYLKSSSFADELSAFRTRIGVLNLDLRFAVAATVHEDFIWTADQARVESALPTEQRDAYIHLLRAQLYQLVR